MEINSENNLFRNLPVSFLAQIERSVYNRGRRNLVPHLEIIRLKSASLFNDFEDYFIIDSMPLKVCKLARSSRSIICKKDNYSIPNKGYCVSQNSSYYGYKLHAICFVKGVFQSINLSPASVHDFSYLKDIKTQISDYTLIGNSRYLSAAVQLNLFETCNVKLNTPTRNNQNNYKKQPYVFRKKRKRIFTIMRPIYD